MTKNVGRPKDDLKSLPDNWYNEILSMYRDGCSDVEVKALIFEWRGSFSNDLWDRWIKEEPEFNKCVEEGRKLNKGIRTKISKEHSERLKNRRINRNHKKEYQKNRLAYSQRSLLCYHLKKKGNSKSKKTFDLFGYTPKDLYNNISGKLKEGMTMDNYGEWHIDHIKPLSLFDLSNDDQIKEAWSFNNLQPLWAKENISKSNKYGSTEIEQKRNRE